MFARDMPSTPAANAVEFRLSKWRSAAMELINALVVVAVAGGALILWQVLSAGNGPADTLRGIAIQSAILFPVLFGLGLWLRWREPPFVRLSDDGIELAATRTNRVFVPWSAVVSVSARRVGPFAILHVAAQNANSVSGANAGRGWPLARARDGGCTLRVEAGLLHPGREVLQAELERRLAARSRQSGRRRR